MEVKNIAGITFAPFCRKGVLSTEEAKVSLQALKERTNANYIILAPQGMQETTISETIDFTSPYSADASDLCTIIEYAHELGLAVALKPTVNCKDGMWRAHIHFFDEDVPCEPKWHNWFASYSAFQRYYARIGQKMGCEMHIAGCEMVMTEHRDAEWRQLISDIRTEYQGLVSYNTDKYQEHNVSWWDCVDVISASGYYPIHDWERQLDRIEAVVKKFEKPFFFAEAGCMSVSGSQLVPNDWTVKGEPNEQVQADWYEAMFSSCKKRDWVAGFALWSWRDTLYPLEQAAAMGDYELYGKAAEAVVAKYYDEIKKKGIVLKK